MSAGGRQRSPSVWKLPKSVAAVFCLAFLWILATLSLQPSRQGSVAYGGSRQDDAFVEEGGGRPSGPGRQQVEDVDHHSRSKTQRADSGTATPAQKLQAVMQTLESFLGQLHTEYASLEPGPSPKVIWDMYAAAVGKWLIPMDQKIAEEGPLFEVREDDSIFMSIASYRDDQCPTTLQEMFAKASKPERLFVGLVQQNCVENCMTGVLEGGVIEQAPPDVDCYAEFCESELGAEYCSHVRLLAVNESESLGPAVARYLASKLWAGENFFMQIDAHSLFVQGWDEAYAEDIRSTPSYPKSVLSHYPPDALSNYQRKAAPRLCGAEFATSEIEHSIVRLTANVRGTADDTKPCPAAFLGAGLVFGHASMLSTLPFDPYVPWVFMGEEIMLSLRLWTWGFDFYGPTRSFVGHFYVRKHKPKFWETVNRLFQSPGAHNSITAEFLNRVKHLAGYPESSEALISISPIPDLLVHQDDLYGFGPERDGADYLRIAGVDPVGREMHRADWCYKCEAPYKVIPYDTRR
jgi:hypothetical protein